MGFSLVMHGTIPKDEILGVVVGHVWYFFSDVWPGLHDGQKPLDPPGWWRRLWEGRPQQEVIQEEDTDAGHIGNDIAAVAAPEVH